VAAAPRRRARGHIRQLPSGSFQAIVYAGTDPLTRKPRYLRETAKTYSVAAETLTRLQSQVDQNRDGAFILLLLSMRLGMFGVMLVGSSVWLVVRLPAGSDSFW
jgi:hypothetical protein